MNTTRWIEEAVGEAVVGKPVLVQDLWSGFGRLERVPLESTTVILKAVEPGASEHPRGWTSDRSHERKLRSYAVERSFYGSVAGALDEKARVPRCIASRETATGGQLLLEDLDAVGLGGRRTHATEDDVRECLRWLAEFHARFLGRGTEGLWERGTYWHLATRPDELQAMGNERLRRAAESIDARIAGARYQTLVHGDAKLANFCFRESGDVPTAAVDFQYVGGGVGVQDIAYFLGSCYGDDELSLRANGHLDLYFEALGQCLARAEKEPTIAAVEAEWRELWPVAWADFHRFLDGWAPGHWKLSAYSAERVNEALAQLDSGS